MNGQHLQRCVRWSTRHRRVGDRGPGHAGPRSAPTGHSLYAYIAPVSPWPVIFTRSRWRGGPSVSYSLLETLGARRLDNACCSCVSSLHVSHRLLHLFATSTSTALVLQREVCQSRFVCSLSFSCKCRCPFSFNHTSGTFLDCNPFRPYRPYDATSLLETRLRERSAVCKDIDIY